MTTPTISHVSASQFLTGNYPRYNTPTILIVVNSSQSLPKAKLRNLDNFISVYDFVYDIEDVNGDESILPGVVVYEIIKVLKRALNDQHNVLVQCSSGLYKSSTIAYTGLLMGFKGCLNDVSYLPKDNRILSQRLVIETTEMS